MTKDQLEDGFVKIPNAVMDSLAKTRIPGEQRQCLDFIIRRTAGFQKEEDNISNTQFCAATGLSKGNVSRAIKTLVGRKIVIKNDNGVTPMYCFNKDCSNWCELSKKPVIKIDNKEKCIPVIKIDNKEAQKGNDNGAVIKIDNKEKCIPVIKIDNRIGGQEEKEKEEKEKEEKEKYTKEKEVKEKEVKEKEEGFAPATKARTDDNEAQKGNDNGAVIKIDNKEKCIPVIKIDNKEEKQEEKEESSAEACPTQEIIALYHRTLPALPALQVLTAARKAHIKARWAEHPDLEWWGKYFGSVRDSDFLCGRISNTHRQSPSFVANLEWLVKPGNMAKVIEGNYANRAPANRAPVNQFEGF